MYPAFDASVAGIASLISVLLVLFTTVVVLRFMAWSMQKSPLLADDWLMVPGLVSVYSRRVQTKKPSTRADLLTLLEDLLPRPDYPCHLRYVFSLP